MKTTCPIAVAAIPDASLSLPTVDPPASRQNVLLLFADDMRATAIAGLGNSSVKMFGPA